MPTSPMPAPAPIQMTRAQFQSKYGQAPTLPLQPQPTPPLATAPVQMTHAEYMAKYGSQPAADTSQSESNGPEGTLGFAGDMTGVEKLGEGLGTTLNNVTGGLEPIQQALSLQQESIDNVRKAIEENKAEGKDTSHLEEVLQQANQSYMATAKKLGDVGTGGLTTKDVLGSAAQTAITIGTAGLGNVGTGAATQLGLKGAAATAAKIGVNSATGAALGYSSDVAQNAINDKDNVFTPGAGTYVGAAIPLASALIGALGKQVLAKTTGAGTEVLNQAMQKPEAVSQAIDTYATTPEAKQSLVDRAKATVNDFLHQRGLQYGSDINQLTSKGTMQGKADVLTSFQDNVATFGGKIKNGALSFTDSTLTKTDQNNLKQAFSTISGWKNTSVKGMDGLRQAIGNLMDEFSLSGNTRANVVLGKIKDDLVASVERSAPGYKGVLAAYGQKTQLARNVLRELSLSGAAKPSTQLSGVMKLFKKDPSVRAGLTKMMGAQQADNFMSELSGAILADWFPPGVVGNAAKAALEGGAALAAGATAGFGTGAAVGAAGLAAMSPRIVGKAATLVGHAAKAGITTGLRNAATLGASRL